MEILELMKDTLSEIKVNLMNLIADWKCEWTWRPKKTEKQKENILKKYI